MNGVTKQRRLAALMALTSILALLIASSGVLDGLGTAAIFPQGIARGYAVVGLGSALTLFVASFRRSNPRDQRTR